MENVLTLHKLLSLWFCFLLHSVDISNLISYIQNFSSNELARPIMGTIFLVIVVMMTTAKLATRRMKKNSNSNSVQLQNMGFPSCEFVCIFECIFWYISFI